MSNWNLDNFDSIYASLAQSAYTGRPIVFDYSSLKKDQQKALDSGQSVRFDFSQDVEKKGQITQGASGDGYPDKSDPKASKTELYLQPDQQGLLTDEKTGYQAYYVSDTAEINQDTHQTYFVVRGSDGFGIDTDKLAKDPLDYLANMNPSDFNYEDWINNDMAFALTDAIVPQAGEATKGMKAKIAELNARAASDAQMSITGHSLGTMVSIQGAAGLSHAELQKVDQIVLFNGPDATKSLQKAGYSKEHIQELGSKTTYYVNPFDPVSMLNREKPWEEQLGTVKVIVPMEYTSMTDKHSSHDFGAYQIDSHGNPLAASADYHPELLTAGHDLAALEKKSIDKLKEYIPEDLIQSIVALSPDDFNELAKLAQKVAKNPSLSGGAEVIEMAAKLGINVSDLVSALTHAGELKDVFQNFQKEYQAIIDKAKKESLKWTRDNINSFHDKIKQATGAQKILLRTELLYMATQLAEEDVTNKVEAAKKHISDVKDEVKVLSEIAIAASKGLGAHLSDSEIEELTSEIKMSNIWDEGTEEADKAALDTYKNKMSTFGSDLVLAAQNIEAVDSQQAGDIFANLS